MIDAVVFGFLYSCVTAFVLLVSVEFGGAMLLLTRRWLDPDDRLLGLLLRYMGPTWETTATFLVLCVVGYGLSFPNAVPALATPFLVPLSVALFAMVVRIGTFIALYIGVRDRRLGVAFGVSSAVCSVGLSSFFVVWAGANSLDEVLHSALTYALIPMALVVPIAATGIVLGVVARRDEEAEAALALQLRHIGAIAALSLPVVGIGLRIALGRVDPGHLDSLDRVWYVFAISGLLAAAGVVLVWSAELRRQFIGAGLLALQFVVAFTTYGATEGPTLGPGRPPLHYALNSGAGAQWLAISAVVGMIVLIPSLALLVFVVRPWRPALQRARSRPPA